MVWSLHQVFPRYGLITRSCLLPRRFNPLSRWDKPMDHPDVFFCPFDCPGTEPDVYLYLRASESGGTRCRKESLSRLLAEKYFVIVHAKLCPERIKDEGKGNIRRFFK